MDSTARLPAAATKDNYLRKDTKPTKPITEKKSTARQNAEYDIRNFLIRNSSSRL